MKMHSPAWILKQFGIGSRPATAKRFMATSPFNPNSELFARFVKTGDAVGIMVKPEDRVSRWCYQTREDAKAEAEALTKLTDEELARYCQTADPKGCLPPTGSPPHAEGVRRGLCEDV